MCGTQVLLQTLGSMVPAAFGGGGGGTGPLLSAHEEGTCSMLPARIMLGLLMLLTLCFQMCAIQGLALRTGHATGNPEQQFQASTGRPGAFG